MDKSRIWIVLVLAAGGILSLLGLLAAPLGSGEPPPKQEPDRSKQSVADAQIAAKHDAKRPNATLFKNAKVFDGKSNHVTASTSVPVVGNKIEKIGGDIAAPENATLIDTTGRTLMPGLIALESHRKSRSD